MLASALFGVAISIAPNVARADEATAEALFQAAKTLMDQKKYAEACPKFEASYKLDPGVGTKLNIADCHEKEGKIAKAWGEWGEARDQAKRENDKARMELAARRQKELEPRIPKLTVNVTGPVSGLVVFRDELQLDSAMLGVPLPVEPGAHVITLRRGKTVVSEKRVEIAEKATEEVTIDATTPSTPSITEKPKPKNGAPKVSPGTSPPKVVMVRKSKGMLAGGIILSTVGGFTTIGSLFADSFGVGAVVFLAGAGMTTGGIILAVKGNQRVPKPATALEIPPPSVFIGPGSIMVRGQF